MQKALPMVCIFVPSGPSAGASGSTSLITSWNVSSFWKLNPQLIITIKDILTCFHLCRQLLRSRLAGHMTLFVKEENWSAWWKLISLTPWQHGDTKSNPVYIFITSKCEFSFFPLFRRAKGWPWSQIIVKSSPSKAILI